MEAKVTTILREKLAGKNLSQVARDLKISKSLLSDWVSSRRTPSLKNIEALGKLASYLGLSLQELLTGHNDERKILTAVTFEDDEKQFRITIERLK